MTWSDPHFRRVSVADELRLGMTLKTGAIIQSTVIAAWAKGPGVQVEGDGQVQERF